MRQLGDLRNLDPRRAVANYLLGGAGPKTLLSRFPRRGNPFHAPERRRLRRRGHLRTGTSGSVTELPQLPIGAKARRRVVPCGTITHHPVRETGVTVR